MHLGLEPDTDVGLDGRLYRQDQGEDVLRPRPGLGHDEVRVLGRHLGAADPMPLPAGRLDQSRGVVVRAGS